MTIKIVARGEKKQYVLLASAADCHRIEAAGIDIENAMLYGERAVRSKANKTKSDNLRKLARLKR